MAKTTFFKVGVKSSLFYDRINKISVNRHKPTKFTGTLKPSKILANALAGGAIQEITEDEYEKLMEGYGKQRQKVKAEKARLEKERETELQSEENLQKKASKKAPAKPVDDDEDDDDGDDDDEDDDDAKAPPKKVAPKK